MQLSLPYGGGWRRISDIFFFFFSCGDGSLFTKESPLYLLSVNMKIIVAITSLCKRNIVLKHFGVTLVECGVEQVSPGGAGASADSLTWGCAVQVSTGQVGNAFFDVILYAPFLLSSLRSPRGGGAASRPSKVLKAFVSDSGAPWEQ